MWGTRFKFLLAAAILILGLIFLKYWTPDISHDELAAKYATGASDFIELPSGATAHYRMQGNDEGPAIILLHGSNSSLHTWEGWVDLLEDDYFVVTVDLPGHGLTGATPSNDYTYADMVLFLKEFTQELGFKEFFIAGNSMGGGVSIKYALSYPTDISGLILVNSAGINTPASARNKVDPPLAFQLAGHWYSSWIVENITPRKIVEEGLLKSVHNPRVISSEIVDRYWELALHPGNRSATNKRFAWYREGRKALPVEDIKIPTLVLWGKQDRIIPVEVAHEFKKRITGSELIVFEGLGHIPMEESPIETARAANKFITQLLQPSEPVES